MNTGRCLPCEMRGLGSLAATNALAPETKRDLVAGAVAFTMPIAYQYGAPKKWPRFGIIVNLGAVAGLYFLTQWALGKIKAST